MVAARIVVVHIAVAHIVAVDIAVAHIAVVDTGAISGAIAGSDKHVLLGDQDDLELHGRQYPALAGLPRDEGW